MHTLTDSLADNLYSLPVAQPVAEVDPQAVVASAADCDLTYAELDRWSNRMARLLLRLGAGPGTRIAVAIDQPIESVVAERAATKLGAVTVPVTDDGSYILGTAVGITTKDQRPESADEITWLVLDERSTLQRYLTSSSAPLRAADLDLLPKAA
ncbi:AMP-binding protein [Nocardia implantans]|uniref:AMP-binding protein n=1 Tax=Nocardia implantans TaxID=3108168 RepID=A0ABU6AT01_9NOCA|nr:MULTISPECIES: AMP-binding protein [unclassified Nocardia]MBF6190949.1 AMP-binding protein [Nocardia beijingensis]MEA3528940.1 AMP-binding protein [Nocardia sp. CDC192]MEB3510605.1 AMP-binding protein [Nocardia sp. CDC186]